MGVATRNLINICNDFAEDFKGVLMDIKSQSEIRAESGHIELMKIDINLDFERKIEALKEAMTKSVSSKASGIISRSFCQPAISYGINALGDQVERAITKSTETFRDRAVRIHEDQRKEYAIEVVAGDKKDEKLSKAKPDSYDKKVLSGAKDDVLDESKPGDITSLAGISESNKKKIEIYDESGKIIKVVGGSYKGEAIRLKYMKGEALGHYENLDHQATSSTGYDCLYKACGASLGKSSMDVRRDIVSSMDRNPGAFSQMIFARNYLDSKPMGKASLMQGGYMEPKVDIAKYYMVGGEIVRDEGLGTELHRPDMKTLKERGEEISKQFEEFAGEGYDRARAFVRGLDEVGQTLLLSIIPAEKLFHYGFTGIKIVKDLKLVATLFPKIKKQYDIYTGNHTGLTREARNELAKIFIKGNRKDILKGLKGEGFKLAEKALDKIPQSLKDTNIFKPNSSGIGIKIGDKQNSIRIDKAVKKSRHGKILQTHEKIDHVKVIRNGQTIGRDGNVIKETKQYPNTSKNPESHIPLKEWLNWKSGLEK